MFIRFYTCPAWICARVMLCDTCLHWLLAALVHMARTWGSRYLMMTCFSMVVHWNMLKPKDWTNTSNNSECRTSNCRTLTQASMALQVWLCWQSVKSSCQQFTAFLMRMQDTQNSLRQIRCQQATSNSCKLRRCRTHFDHLAQQITNKLLSWARDFWFRNIRSMVYLSCVS